MVLGDEIRMENDLKSGQRELIEPLLKHYFNGCYAQLSMNVSHVYFLASLAIIPIVLLTVIIVIMIRRRKKNGSR